MKVNNPVKKYIEVVGYQNDKTVWVILKVYNYHPYEYVVRLRSGNQSRNNINKTHPELKEWSVNMSEGGGGVKVMSRGRR